MNKKDKAMLNCIALFLCKNMKIIVRNLQKPIDKSRNAWYNIYKEVRPMDSTIRKIKKLIKLLQQLNKLMIEIIAFATMVITLIKLLI